MSSDDIVKQRFPIKCLGRDNERKEILSKSVDVEVRFLNIPCSDTLRL